MSDIKWHEWNDEAFKLAKKEKCPILLDISANWCHWCHIMDTKTYADEQVQEKLKQDFVCIRVDTDRRPDINSRYNLGGWPTTAFLYHNGELITGGTFLNSEQMLEVLQAVKSYVAKTEGGEKPDFFPEAGTYQMPGPPKGEPEKISDDATNYFANLARANYDTEFGGFGRETKFPHSATLDLLATIGFQDGGDAVDMLNHTLTTISQTDIYDPDKGGVFRYSTQRDWSKPHREKLLIDQAELAMVYLDTFSFTANQLFADTAARILDYMEETLLQPDGCFYGSQSADSDYYRLSEAERAKTQPPKVDKTTYSDSTARACSAFVKADTILGRGKAMDIALRGIYFLFNNMLTRNKLFQHYIDERGAGGPSFLSDQANALMALLDIYEATGNSAFITEATSLAKAVEAQLIDKSTNALFDHHHGRDDIGALKLSYWPIDYNARSAKGLMRLAHLTGDNRHQHIARLILGAFTSSYRDYGLLASEYATAVTWLTKPPVEIFIEGDNMSEEKNKLWQAARFTYHPRKVILLGDEKPLKSGPDELKKTEKPAALVQLGPKHLMPTSNPEELMKHLTQAA